MESEKNGENRTYMCDPFTSNNSSVNPMLSCYPIGNIFGTPNTDVMQNQFFSVEKSHSDLGDVNNGKLGDYRDKSPPVQNDIRNTFPRNINSVQQENEINIRRSQTSPSMQELGNRNNNTICTIDCDVLFLTDSNLHKMKPEIMNHGSIS